MPVDKFGRTDSGATGANTAVIERVVSGGVTLSQVTDNFVSKSGDIMTGDLAMNGHRLTGLPTDLPGFDSDATSWFQVKSLVSDVMTNNGTVPAGPLYLTNKQYVDGQDAMRVLKTGDTMSGDLTLSIGSDHLRIIGCTDLNDNSAFNICFGDNANKIKYQKHHPVLLETTNGFLCKHKGQDMVRFGGRSANDTRTVVYHDIIMSNKAIVELRDPRSAQDAATKNYVDNAPKKNYVGYIPPLEGSISKSGFAVEGSSVANRQFLPYGPFNNNYGSWLTAPNNTTGWLQVKCPEQVRIWKVALKARNFDGRNITSWEINGSNNGTSFTTLLTSTTTLEGAASSPSFFNVTSNDAYQYYRFTITASTGSTDVGVHYMQLYVYDI